MLLVSEILDKFEAAKTREEKIAVLQSNVTDPLLVLLRLNYDHMLKMDLPDGEPPFRKDTDKPIGYSESSLQLELRRFYVWLEPNVNLPKIKKESLFVSLLEGIHWTEAEALCLAKDRKLQTKYKSLKEDIVREAFPRALTPKPVKEKADKKEESAPLE
ncbi:hypothetical protein UFOVP242_88 [uncultured Caudovirales phage]|uniref:Uncharacterized protein n=1 Tax=uncultured Caudovirales phage TaxID=2100421 RepID=A0A6J7WY58_9CAUD|nr:hypothetical protein UFOVP242_88 [uncultured Caudovirales phage]